MRTGGRARDVRPTRKVSVSQASNAMGKDADMVGASIVVAKELVELGDTG